MEHKRARQNVVLPQIGVRTVDTARAVHEKLGFFLKLSAGLHFIFFIAYYLAEALKLVGHRCSRISNLFCLFILKCPDLSPLQLLKNVATWVKLQQERLELLCNDKHGLPKICKIELYARKLLT